MSAVETDQQLDLVIALLERIAEAVESLEVRKSDPILDGMRQRLERFRKDAADRRKTEAADK